MKKNKKNPFPALFLAKMGLDRPRKREKNFSPEFHSYSTRARKFRKKITKKFKKLKNLFLALFIAKTILGRPRKGKKIIVPNSAHTRPGQENSKKIAKKFKKLKKLFLSLFIAKTG